MTDSGNQGGRNDHDPWSDNNGDRSNKSSPPDLEQAIKRIFKKMGAVGNGGGGDFNQGADDQDGGLFAFAATIFLLVALLWALSGIYIVKPAQKAVVLRFGKYLKTVGPGPHWAPRFIDTRYIISVQDIMDYHYKAEMLTREENIVSVGVAVQFRIGNPQDYLFKVINPNESLKQATTSVLRQVVGDKRLDEVLTYGQADSARVSSRLGNEIATLLSEVLDSYQTGIIVTDVAIQFIKPPQAVIGAFDDVIIASEEKVRFVNEANIVSKRVVLQAKGESEKIIQEANANAQSKIASARAKTANFLGELPQYKLTPKITRERLYLQTMEDILKNNNKLFLTAKNSNNLLYMPLDKLMHNTMNNNAKSVKLNSVDLRSRDPLLGQYEASASKPITRVGRSQYTGREGREGR